MTVQENQPARRASGAFTWPLAALALCGACAIGAVSLWEGSLSHQSASAPGDSIRNVEFLAANPSTYDSLHHALSAACAETGCEAPMVGSMIIAATQSMSSDTLALALDAQVALLNRMTPAVESEPDQKQARALRLQWEAEAQIADLYRAELVRRQN
ncbi:hypothetical protein JANAI62_06020 [Jannaschia pagri]|uniref:Heavy-metal resistance n=1 Tax=Jannaschia pagri TaxID=2829797 RepID=A0ABQ4NHS5_9RHOB|nr:MULTISPECIES: hypothetical protein [unclassified Jannaschia]GIT89914.1 hypothetical protein JANAI61_03720 [Jannaschia sp. AI_61]GIT93979.1 hypothetical protein JANAI62_06020 [Jannaschia sp. AI_62]